MRPAPPRLARSLLLLIPQPHREFVEGDLEEAYAARLPLGRSRAGAWYWGQVLATVPPVCAHAALVRLRKALTPTDPQRRTHAMASPPRKPVFGSVLVASRPARLRSQLATSLASVVLHAGIVGGLVYGTMGNAAETVYEKPVIVEIIENREEPPPETPPPVDESALPSTAAPPSITPPDVIPPEIPPPGNDRITADDIYKSILDEAARDTTEDRSERVTNPGDQPTFTPYTFPPKMQNVDEVSAALEREYPPLLRDAGVGGRVEVWIRLDDRGVVEKVQVNVSSGHPALDEAALEVARIIEFSPAMNRDKAVPVWVSVPITFQVR